MFEPPNNFICVHNIELMQLVSSHNFMYQDMLYFLKYKNQGDKSLTKIMVAQIQTT